MDKMKGQVLGEIKGIYSRIRYLGEKKKVRKCEKGSRRI